MSFRTLIEINHDRGIEIERDPERFVRELLEQIRAGQWNKGQRILGGEFIAMRHHSEKFEVSPHDFRIDIRPDKGGAR